MIELLGIHSGALDRALRRDSGQFHGCKIAQLPAVAPHGSARPAHDRNVIWLQHGPLQHRKAAVKLASLAAGTQVKQPPAWRWKQVFPEWDSNWGGGSLGRNRR